MDKECLEMSNILYDIKEKISDNEYMNAMNKLSNIRKKYQVDVEGKNICKCIVEEINFCTSSIESFMTCKNIRHTLNKFPILRNQLILYSLPNYNLEIYEYNHNQLFKSDLQLEPINLDIMFDKDARKEYINYSKLLLYITDNIDGKIQKIFVSITIFDYVFKNFGFVLKEFKYMETLYNKLDELSLETNNDSDNPIIELIKRLYNLEDNPYKIFQNIMKPYYQKGLLNKEIIEHQNKKHFIPIEFIENEIENEIDNDIDNINERFPPAIQQLIFNALMQDQQQQPNIQVFEIRRPLQQEQRRRHSRRQHPRRQLHREQRQQAEEEVIQESRYPLRNRIQSKMNNNLIYAKK